MTAKIIILTATTLGAAAVAAVAETIGPGKVWEAAGAVTSGAGAVGGIAWWFFRAQAIEYRRLTERLRQVEDQRMEVAQKMATTVARSVDTTAEITDALRANTKKLDELVTALHYRPCLNVKNKDTENEKTR